MKGVTRAKGNVVHPGKLDVYAYGQLDLVEVSIDVAVKHPCTESLQAKAAVQFGFAADLAENEKLRDYRLPPGKVLTPFGVETFGRLGNVQNPLCSVSK